MQTPPNPSRLAIVRALRRSGRQCAAAQWAHLTHSHARLQALRLALCPVDFWRLVEFPAVLEAYRDASPVLDLGSPRLLARYLARQRGAQVIACDLSPVIADEARMYGRGPMKGGVHGIRGNGTTLPFADHSFPFAYSVSVVEHIADEGDMLALDELARVVSPGGRCVITVPCAPVHEEIWLGRDVFGGQRTREDGGVFFCRLYDWDSARTRLLERPAWDVEALRAWHVRDTRLWERYRLATAQPRSFRSIWTKLRDVQHSQALLEACIPLKTPIRERAVLAAVLRRRP